ncbi:MAG: DUF2240 family protein [Methermicoccaceae archaeon]
MKETKNVVASTFKKVGKPTMSESEFVLALSFGFGWCSPELARRLINNAIAHKLLRKEENLLTPMFDVDSHELPAMYSPPEEVFEECTKRDLLEEVLLRLSKSTDGDTLREVDDMHTQLKGAVHREVAALLVAKKHKVAVDDLIDECMQRILR